METRGLVGVRHPPPMTPTGTNLLGLVKHLAGVEIGYFGDTFGRPFDGPLPWSEDDEPEQNADFWATSEEPREQRTHRRNRRIARGQPQHGVRQPGVVGGLPESARTGRPGRSREIERGAPVPRSL
jgi:hypothetical protein